jgi:hypothetical protein
MPGRVLVLRPGDDDRLLIGQLELSLIALAGIDVHVGSDTSFHRGTSPES